MIENPYWFDLDGTASLTKNVEQHTYFDEFHHSHSHRKRAKRNHNRKMKISLHSTGKTAAVAKRSVSEDEKNILPDEIFSASEVISNIFNENDTRDSTKNNGKYDGK